MLILATIQFVSGQENGQPNNQFTELELDGVYIGMRQANHYKQKVKEQEEALVLYDSLVDSFQVRLQKSAQREEGYLMIIDNTNKAWEIDKKIWENNVTIQKKKNKKWLKILVPSALVVGGIIGATTTN